jgi:hypothetical protein
MRHSILATLILLAGLVPLRGQTPDKQTDIAESLQTLRYLASLVIEDGGFLPVKGEKKPTLRATSAALRAIKYRGGGQMPDPTRTVKFVASCFDRTSGGFVDRPGEGKPDVATTAVGLMAVVELKMPLEDYSGPASRFLEKNARTFEEIRIAAAGFEAIGKKPTTAGDWLKTLASMRNKDGTFGKGEDLARATGGAVAAQLRLGETISDPATILKAMRGGQRTDGGFGKEGAKTSDLETSYRVTRCFVMLKERPDVPKLKAFIARCRNADGGYGVTPRAQSSVSGTYFASIILHWLDRK